MRLRANLRSDVSNAYVTNESNKENISVTQPSANSDHGLSDTTTVEQLTSSTSGVVSEFDSTEEGSLIKPTALIDSEHL